MADYERLRGGQLTAITAESIADLAPALIKARIMRNWTQKELADKLASAKQQVQRYEATQYKRKFLTDIPDSLVNTLTGFALENEDTEASIGHYRYQARIFFVHVDGHERAGAP